LGIDFADRVFLFVMGGHFHVWYRDWLVFTRFIINLFVIHHDVTMEMLGAQGHQLMTYMAAYHSLQVYVVDLESGVKKTE